MANYILLERITVGAAGAASVTFNNIPQTGYTDLKIVMSVRSTQAAVVEGIVTRFNADNTSGNYTHKRLYGNGASAVSDSSTIPIVNDGASATASTFSNIELYIPNYTSSNAKSWSADAVQENNATTAYAALIAGLWSGTAAINKVVFSSENSANFVQYSTFSLYGLAAVGATPAIDPKATGGDIIQTDGTYWYHAFLSSGTFTPKVGLTCDVLTIGGGGGGGNQVGGNNWGGGGGGAGGLLYQAAASLTSATTYTATIGAGGATHTNGANSSFIGGALSLSGIGGGYGSNSTGTSSTSAGGNGGSGGGGSYQSGAGGTGTTGQGYAGGSGPAGNANGAGGGGAGAVGQDSSTSAGVGGIGSSTYSAWGAATNTGQNVSGTYYYAGGGGGGSQGANAAAGGNGGGGTGEKLSTSNATAGAPNTGGGGGGATNTANVGAAGGSGVVIVRYTVA